MPPTVQPGSAVNWAGPSQPAAQGSGPWFDAEVQPSAHFFHYEDRRFDLKALKTIQVFAWTNDPDGIEKVVFAVDDGTPVAVTVPTLTDFELNTEFNEAGPGSMGPAPMYEVDLDPTDFPDPKTYWFYAVAYPVNGLPYILDAIPFQGGSASDWADDTVVTCAPGQSIIAAIQAAGDAQALTGRTPQQYYAKIKITAGSGPWGRFDGGHQHDYGDILFDRPWDFVLDDGLDVGDWIVNDGGDGIGGSVNLTRCRVTGHQILPSNGGDVFKGRVGDEIWMSNYKVVGPDRCTQGTNIIDSHLVWMWSEKSDWLTTRGSEYFPAGIRKMYCSELSSDVLAGDRVFDVRARACSRFKGADPDVVADADATEIVSGGDAVHADLYTNEATCTHRLVVGVYAVEKIAAQGWENHGIGGGTQTRAIYWNVWVDNTYGQIPPRSAGDRAWYMDRAMTDCGFYGFVVPGNEMILDGATPLVVTRGVMQNCLCGGQPVTASMAQSPNDARDAGWIVRGEEIPRAAVVLNIGGTAVVLNIE